MIIEKSERDIRKIIDEWAESYFINEIYGFGLSDDISYPTFFDEDMGFYEAVSEDIINLHELGFKADTHRMGRRAGRGFRVKAVFDNNPKIQNTSNRGYKIISPNDIVDIENVKIAVFPRRYHAIKNQLEEYGLVEYKDFIFHGFFVAFYNYFIENKVMAWEATQAVTTRCTLKCNGCNMFMPYYKKPEDVPLDALSADIDAFFSRVGYVQKFSILGGEPLLHAGLAEYLQKLKLYSNRIGEIIIATNGSIVPKDDLLKLAQDMENARIEINDYNISGWYSDNMNILVEKVKHHELSYTLRSYDWSRFRRDSPINDVQELKHHYNRCNQPFPAFQDKRYYTCHLPWSAAQCRIGADDPQDYIDFTSSSVTDLDIVMAGLGHLPRGYTSNCAMCNGCDPHYYEKMPKAEQL